MTKVRAPRRLHTGCRIRDRDAPLARATAAIPPCPNTRPSAAITSRCCRSSKCGSIAPNFARNPAHHVRIDSHSTFWRAKSQIERLFIDVPLRQTCMSKMSRPVAGSSCT
jgi:hypothetical protein